MLERVNPKLKLLAEQQGGVFSRQQAISGGYTAKQVRSRLDDGRWVRIRHGQYAEQPDLSALSLGSCPAGASPVQPVAWPASPRSATAPAMGPAVGAPLAAGAGPAGTSGGRAGACGSAVAASGHVVVGGARVAGDVRLAGGGAVPVDGQWSGAW